MSQAAGRSDVEVELVPAAAAQPVTEVVPPAKQNDDIPRGIAFMVGATVLFSVSSAFAKWQVAIYPVGEVMFFRSFSSLVVCAAFILPFTGFSVFATRRPGAHIARGLSQSISQTFSVIAFSMMPLAGAVAINFSAPLWSALLSVLWLKERAGPVRWLVLLIGFLGVLIVTNPGADSLQVGALFALGNAVMYGSVTVAVRGMTATESATTLLMWQIGHDRGVPLFPAAVRFPLAGAARHRNARMQRRRQRDRAAPVDPRAASRTGDGSIAVLLSHAGVGAGDRIRRMGRRADARTSGRLRDRGRVGAVPALARVAAPPLRAAGLLRERAGRQNRKGRFR